MLSPGTFSMYSSGRMQTRSHGEILTMDILTLIIPAVILIIIVAILVKAIRIVNEWERAVLLFLGKFVGIKGPGINFNHPVAEPDPVYYRSPGHNNILQGRTDINERHGPGKCRCSLILAGD